MMRLALNSVIFNEPLSLQQRLSIAAETGFEGVDVGLDELAALADPREPFASSGVEPASCGLPVRWSGSEEEFAADLQALPALCEAAVAAGCPRTMTWLPPTTPGEPEAVWQMMVERFGRIADVMAPCGVRLGLEWIGPWHARQQGSIVLYTMPATLELIARIGRPNIGLLLDSWHWFMAGGTICEIEALAPEQIVHVHFVDAPDRPYEEQLDFERAIPGEGIIDLVAFVRALDDIGYSDFASAEVFGEALRRLPPLEAARKLKAGCDAVVARARG